MKHVLSVDMIACDGRGICADLFPERVALDDWGYPIIDPAPIDRQLLGHARRCVSNCPTLALRLTPVRVRPHRSTPGRPLRAGRPPASG